MSSDETIDVVVMGASPTGLYAVRELARAGFSVAVVDASPGCAFQSRHVRDASRHFIGSVEAIDAWLSGLASRQTGKPVVLLPSNDVFIEFVLQHAARLAPSFRFAPSYNGMATRLLDKSAFHGLCLEHGMETPGIWNAEDNAALTRMAGSIPFPCILKPILIHHARVFLKGKKVLLARDRQEFLAHVARMPDGLGGWLVQEIIPGPESEITLFGTHVDRTGESRQAFTARKLRQYPPGFGSASLVTSEPCAETHALSVDFVRRIGFSGICGAEYKRDPRDGKLKIIEINPRPTLWFQITHDAGKRIAEAAVRDMIAGAVLPESPQDGSVCWRYGLKDAVSAMFYRRDGGRFVFPPPDVSSAAKARKRSWPVFAADDPRPAMSEPVGYIRKAWKRL